MFETRIAEKSLQPTRIGAGNSAFAVHVRVPAWLSFFRRLRRFSEEFMKPNLKQLFVIGATSFLLAGCCTTHHVTHWEYKVVRQNRVGVAYADFAKTQESLMNDLAKDGWIFVSQSDETLCFKRPVR